MRLMVEAIISAGGPATLITTVKEPTLESGNVIMNHKDIPLLSITGGEAVVAVAMKTSKKVIAAGPGNPPVIVDDTADLPDAAKCIVDGAASVSYTHLSPKRFPSFTTETAWGWAATRSTARPWRPSSS